MLTWVVPLYSPLENVSYFIYYFCYGSRVSNVKIFLKVLLTSRSGKFLPFIMVVTANISNQGFDVVRPQKNSNTVIVQALDAFEKNHKIYSIH